MAYTYVVSYSTSSTGPWTQFGSPVSTATDTLTGLAASTPYYVQIIATDSVTGLTSTPVVGGPFTTASSGPVESPSGTFVTAVGQQILSSQTPGSAAPAGGPFDTWTISTAPGPSCQIVHNGVVDTNTANIIELYYLNHYLYQEANAENELGLNPGWWQYTGGTTGNGFGYTACQDPVPAGPQIFITTIAQQNVNTAFTVSGTMTGFTTAPVLQYQDNQIGSWINLPTGNTVTTTAFSFTHPAVTQSISNMTVGVWDANETSVTALSNTFAVIVPGQITITAVTLTGNTFQSGSATGTVVGSVSVTVAGGSFTGSLSVTGTNASSFTISGSNLVTVGVLSGTSYSINVVATMSGATGSPFSQPETITTFTASSSTIAVSVGQTIGTVSPFTFGVATNGLDAPGVNDYGLCTNASWQSTWKTQNFRLLRHNETHITDFVPNSSGNPNSTSATNWLNNAPKFWTQETAPGSLTATGMRQVITLGEYDDVVATPAQAVQIAQMFKKYNMECFYWEAANEPGTSLSNWSSNFVAVRNALKGVNSAYQIGGPCTADANQSWISQAISDGADFISWHVYVEGAGSSISGSACYNAAISRANGDISGHFLPGGGNSTMPVFLGEYNIDWSGNDASMQNIDGALFACLYLYTSMTQINVQMAAIWEMDQNANFTLMNTDGSGMRPNCLCLTALGRKLFGNKVKTTVGSNLPNVTAMATYNSGNWCVWLMNYNTSSTQDFTVALQGLSGSTYNYFEVSANNPTGKSAVNSVASLANLVIPHQSILVLSNF